MNERPNITVIYEQSSSSAPGLGAILVELIFFLFMVGVIGLISGSCSMLK